MTVDASAGAAEARAETQALATAAVAAAKGPSVHHTQPWRWCLTGDELDLYVDYRRGLEVTDLEARLAVLSCGAALHRAVVSLTAAGWHTVLARLPSRAHPDHLAQVHISHQIPVAATVRDRQTIGMRHINGRPNISTGIDGDTVWSITAAVQSTGTRLRLLRPAQAFELSYYLSHDGDLLTSQAQGPAAVVAVLYGSEDSTLAWLRAGEALSAALLTATELAISVTPLCATIETAATREKIRRFLGGPGYPYLVLRLSTIGSDDPTGPHTPSLPAEQTSNGGDAEVGREGIERG